MLKKEITWTDFDGNERTETFYFNLSKVEVAAMEMSVDGGWVKWVERVVKEKREPVLIELFKDLILQSYGIKSNDGRRFEKSPEISKEFSETGAFEVLFLELSMSAEAAAAFFNGIVPQDVEVQ